MHGTRPSISDCNNYTFQTEQTFPISSFQINGNRKYARKLAKLSFCNGDLKQSQAITTLEAIPAGVNVDVVIE